MKAVVHDRYGPPEVLRIEDVERPIPKENEVLVRITRPPSTGRREDIAHPVVGCYGNTPIPH
jgi:hypothetical protein